MTLPAFRDLFARHRARATGLWRVGREAVRTIYLDQGEVVYATSTHPHDRLTHLLVERGNLTQAQLDYALVNLNPAMSVGKNLIEMGFITQRDLLEVARAQVERVVRACLASGDAPAFEARALDAATVRLPFDTPALLLGCALGLGDREAVLDELGPLNQVVVLEGRRLLDLALPVDLGRLTVLLDGSRTLLELGRETGVEPFRLGAFALYLREMGWARLHELPPLDRSTLELALEPTAPVLTGPLPIRPDTVEAPGLMENAAAPEPDLPLTVPTPLEEEPTEAEEDLPPAEEVSLPVAEEDLPPAEEVSLPVAEEDLPPAEGVAPEIPGEEEPVALPAALLGTPLPEEPALPVQPEAAEEEALPEATRSRGPWLPLAALLLVAAATYGASRLLARKRVPPPSGPAPAAPSPAPAVAAPASPAAAPPPAPEPAPAPKPEPPVPAPKPEPPAPPSPPTRAERLQAIARGDWPRVLQQGAAHRRTVEGKWTLRLEIACQWDTVQHAVGLLKDQDPDLFVLPMVMRDGRTCYQVFLGAFASEAAARDATRRLPTPFLAEGNRPKPFRVAQIPDRQ